MKLSSKTKRLGTTSIIGLLLLLFPFIVGRSEYYLNTIIMIGIFLILAVGFQFLLQTGILNFGHTAFMGVGGYISGFLTIHFGLPFWVALPLAGIAAAIVALVIGYPTLRVSGVAFFMISLCLLNVFHLVMGRFGVEYFGGMNGLTGIPHPSISVPGLPPVVLAGGTSYYYLTLVIVLLTVWFFYRVERGGFGRICVYIGSSELMTESLGINSFRTKMIAFMIACFFAGLAGSLYAHYMTIVTPGDFGIAQSLTMQVYVFIGGVGTVFGPVIGALVMGTLSTFIMELAAWENLIYGIILVVAVVRTPGGLWGLIQRLLGKKGYERALF